MSRKKYNFVSRVTYGFAQIELVIFIPIFISTIYSLLSYQSWLQKYLLQLEIRQQAWHLAYYSLEVARARQGCIDKLLPMPNKYWQRDWQIIATNFPCKLMQVTIQAPGKVKVQLSQQWCPEPSLLDI